MEMEERGIVNLEIDTHDRQLAYDLTETSSFSAGQQKSIPGGATVTFKGMSVRKAFDVPNTIELVISFGKSAIAVGLAVKWLYDKIKGRATVIRIDRREIQIEEGKIKRIIEEKIQIQ